MGAFFFKTTGSSPEGSPPVAPKENAPNEYSCKENTFVLDIIKKTPKN